MLPTVIHIMTASAWGEPAIERDISLPKGVRKQKGKFYIMNGGSKKRKFFATPEDASAALADDSVEDAGPNSDTCADAM